MGSVCGFAFVVDELGILFSLLDYLFANHGQGVGFAPPTNTQILVLHKVLFSIVAFNTLCFLEQIYELLKGSTIESLSV